MIFLINIFKKSMIGRSIMTDKTIPWIEKYRPKKVDDVISQSGIIRTLKKCIESKYFPNTIFYGPPGTGKTSTITAFAKEIYGNSITFMVLELNASDDRGIEVVRDKIKSFVSCRSIITDNICNKSNIKLVVLDETDAMTEDAQSILRKVIEEHSKTTRFCLICNYIQKIIPALQSRCTKFRFSPITRNNLEVYIEKICRLENININREGIISVIKHTDGDMRKMLNILQSTNMITEKLSEESILKCIGYPTIEIINNIFNVLQTYNYKDAFEYLVTNKLKYGINLNDIIKEIHNTIISYIINGTKLKNMTIDKALYILDKISDIETFNAYTLNDDIQLSSLIGIFKLSNNI